MSQWPTNRYTGFPPPQNSVQQQQQQLLLQQQLAAAVSASSSTPTATNIGALNTYAQQLVQHQQQPQQQGQQTSLYNNATASLLAQFTNSNQLNQLTTAIAAMQQQQQQPSIQVQQQQQQQQQQNIGFQWSSGGGGGGGRNVGMQQQIIQQPQTSPRNINQFNQQQQPQDPRLANRSKPLPPPPPSVQPPPQKASASPQPFDVRPLMDLDPTTRNQQQQRPSTANYNNNRQQNNSRFNNTNNTNHVNKQSRFQPATTQAPPQSTTTTNNKPQPPPTTNNQTPSTLPRPKSKSPEISSTRRLSTSSHSTITTTTTNNNKSSTTKLTNIRFPKYSLDVKYNAVSGVKTRYSQLYIPSDFTNCKYSWINSFPVERPLKFSTSSKFHIMRKECQSIFINNSVYEPDDINHAWTVRVMLMEMPELTDLYKLNDDQSWRKEDHPNRQIRFLVGTKGKNELMGIGGAWSPSLDGPNPESNPQTLLNTAIRTTMALTGVDLTSCTQWFKMLEIQYNRNEEYKTILTPTGGTSQTIINDISNTNSTNSAPISTASAVDASDAADGIDKEGSNESNSSSSSNFNVKLSLNNDNDIETTVIFMPNVWSLMPNSIEYQQFVDLYRNLIENPDLAPTISSAAGTTPKKMINEGNGGNKLGIDLKDESVDNEDDDDEDNGGLNGSTTEASHYSKLDLRKMKVDDLKEELAARNLETKGLKAQLINRLKEAIDLEKEKEAEEEIKLKIEIKEEEEEGVEEAATAAVEATKTEEQSKLTKPEREKYYKLPTSPQIIVHPSNKAKAGKFDCQLFSLSSLLDYRKDDNKETTFEVSLFAESFNEMLIRDFAFLIYKSLLTNECEKIAFKSVNNLKRKNTAAASSSPTPNADHPDDSKRMKLNDEKSKSTTSAAGGGGNTKIIDQNLLLSFLYFDTNRTNYFLEKDLEDLLLTIGLSLNRSKLKSLINRLNVNKDSTINYRQLTDKLARDVELLANNNVKIQIPTDFELIQNSVNFEKLESKNKTSTASVGKLIEFNGQLVDIENILTKLDKSELSTQNFDNKLKESSEQINDLKSKLKSNDRTKDKLYDEVQDLKKKLKEQQRLNKEIDDKYSRYKDCLYRSKSQLNKLLDDYNDTIKRTTPPQQSKSQQQQQQPQPQQQQQQPIKQSISVVEETNESLKIDEDENRQNESFNGIDDLVVIDSCDLTQTEELND